MNFWGEPAPGRSSGEAMQAMEEAVAQLPRGGGDRIRLNRALLPRAHGRLPGTVGIGVLGGVVTSTFLVTLFAPLFYVIISTPVWTLF